MELVASTLCMHHHSTYVGLRRCFDARRPADLTRAERDAHLFMATQDDVAPVSLVRFQGIRL
eukprot:6186016-Pleurochrysis_carterae.AAC.1